LLSPFVMQLAERKSAKDERFGLRWTRDELVEDA
jgi:hypothetical protein